MSDTAIEPRLGRLMASGSAWTFAITRYGLPWVLLGYLMYAQQASFERFRESVVDQLQRSEQQHNSLSFYLRATCQGVNRDQPHICEPGGGR